MSETEQAKTQGDLDLERIMDLFDRAITSDDPRVMNALRSLMMIVALTAPEDPEAIVEGPWHKMRDQLRALEQRVSSLEMNNSYRGYNPLGKGTDPFNPWSDDKFYTSPNPVWITTAPDTIPPPSGITYGGTTYSTTSTTGSSNWGTDLLAKASKLSLNYDEILNNVKQQIADSSKENK